MALLDAGGQELPAVLMMRRAELMADAGDLAGAAKLAEAAANADPARGLLVRFADIARRSDDPAAAARAYERLEAALGDGEGDRAIRGTLLIARADLLLQVGQWDAAAALMERADRKSTRLNSSH